MRCSRVNHLNNNWLFRTYPLSFTRNRGHIPIRLSNGREQHTRGATYYPIPSKGTISIWVQVTTKVPLLAGNPSRRNTMGSSDWDTFSDLAANDGTEVMFHTQTTVKWWGFRKNEWVLISKTNTPIGYNIPLSAFIIMRGRISYPGTYTHALMSWR